MFPCLFCLCLTKKLCHENINMPNLQLKLLENSVNNHLNQVSCVLNTTFTFYMQYNIQCWGGKCSDWNTQMIIKLFIYNGAVIYTFHVQEWDKLCLWNVCFSKILFFSTDVICNPQHLSYSLFNLLLSYKGRYFQIIFFSNNKGIFIFSSSTIMCDVNAFTENINISKYMQQMCQTNTKMFKYVVILKNWGTSFRLIQFVHIVSQQITFLYRYQERIQP